MNVRSECTIDLDQNRRVWAQVEGDVDSADDIVKVALGAASAAYAAYDKAKQQQAERVDQRIVDRAQKREEEKLRGFQDGS